MDRPENVIGAAVRTVRYRTLPNLAQERHVRFGGVHDVPMGVELETHAGEVFRITWVKDDGVSRVDVAEGPVRERFPGSTLPAVEVEDWDEWREVLSHGLNQLIALRNDDGVTIGLRLVSDHAGSVTAVLGEVDELGQPIWADDNLVVFFDADAAEAYIRSLGHAGGRFSVAS